MVRRMHVVVFSNSLPPLYGSRGVVSFCPALSQSYIKVRLGDAAVIVPNMLLASEDIKQKQNERTNAAVEIARPCQLVTTASARPPLRPVAAGPGDGNFLPCDQRRSSRPWRRKRRGRNQGGFVRQDFANAQRQGPGKKWILVGLRNYRNAFVVVPRARLGPISTAVVSDSCLAELGRHSQLPELRREPFREQAASGAAR